jgi:hypothetical protein
MLFKLFAPIQPRFLDSAVPGLHVSNTPLRLLTSSPIIRQSVQQWNPNRSASALMSEDRIPLGMLMAMAVAVSTRSGMVVDSRTAGDYSGNL